MAKFNLEAIKVIKERFNHECFANFEFRFVSIMLIIMRPVKMRKNLKIGTFEFEIF